MRALCACCACCLCGVCACVLAMHACMPACLFVARVCLRLFVCWLAWFSLIVVALACCVMFVCTANKAIFNSTSLNRKFKPQLNDKYATPQCQCQGLALGKRCSASEGNILFVCFVVVYFVHLFFCLPCWCCCSFMCWPVCSFCLFAFVCLLVCFFVPGSC